MTDHATPNATPNATPPGLRETDIPTSAAPPGEALLQELIARDPDSIPGVLRELVMCRGAMDSLTRSVEDLRGRLHHVVRDPAVDSVPPSGDQPPVSALGAYVRALYGEIGYVERAVQDLTARLVV